LLLAIGQVVTSDEQMEALFERGMLVDIAELQTVREQVLEAPAEQLPALWKRSIDRVGQTLLALPPDGLDAVLDEVAQPLVALVDRDPDLAIFQVLRQHGNCHTQYGVNHSIHCAIAAFLSAHRLGWEALDSQRAFKAALTMNVSMLELQGQLATQNAPLTPRQREAIHAHPLQGARMLKLAGIDDHEWLQAVAEHHETSDGTGYPAGLRNVTPLAALLHRCDVYTAKLSPRRNREALTADVAARGLFSADPDNPMTAALVKEFGLYPPGCFVRLASGEIAIVVKRGLSANHPIVAVMTNDRGATQGEPVRRDTSLTVHAVVSALPTSAVQLRLAPEKLMAVACT
jgi:HD-GYP domain-containing protein (c-di-GMP phosphodiesterase class II)